MKSFTYCIQNQLGIHARPAGELAMLAKDCKSTVVIDNGSKREHVGRLMAVMGMGVKRGQTVTVIVEGEDEDKVVALMEDYFHHNL